MKIHMSNVNFSSRTGPNSFACRLANELTLLGHHIVDQSQEYDIFLAFIEAASVPKKGSKVIQRLDGIWFKPEDFIAKNVYMKSLYKQADHIVWISEFDKQMITKWWGPRQGTVINNGISLTKQNPVHQTGFFYHSPLFVCSANWHMQKRLKDNIKLFNEIKKSNKNAGLMILGKIDEVTRNSLRDIQFDQSIAFVGDQTHENCLRIYASADWIIHLAWLDHYPNSVVEAMSQGCRVICSSDGGTKEIARGTGIIVNENTKYNFELADYDNPPSIDTANFILPSIKRIEQANCLEHLDIQIIAKQYEEVMKSL